MSYSSKVSQAFNMSWSKTPGVEEAKAAEANLNNIPIPIGWEGDCKVVDMVADVSKAGNMYINFFLLPINDEKYGDKPFAKNYTLKESTYEGTTTSVEQKIEKFLNDMERAGLPREVRTGCDGVGDIIAWWLDPDQDRIVHVKYDKIGNGDNPYISLSKVKGAVDTSTAMSPSLPGKETAAPKGDVAVGSMVKYMEREMKVVKVDNGTVDLESPSTGKIRTGIKISELD